MSNIELNATAKDLLSIRSMIAELEAEAEALTDKIKAAMTERGEEVLRACLRHHRTSREGEQEELQ